MWEVREPPQPDLIRWGVRGGALGAFLAATISCGLHGSFLVGLFFVLPGAICGFLPGFVFHMAAHRFFSDSLRLDGERWSRAWSHITFWSAFLVIGLVTWFYFTPAVRK